MNLKKHLLLRGQEVVDLITSLLKEVEDQSTEIARLRDTIDDLRETRARRVKLESKSVVYFVRVGEGAVKIGSTSGLAVRLSQLANHSGQPIEVLGFISGNKDKERELHNQFSGLRLYGEIFAEREPLVSFISNNSMGVEDLARLQGQKILNHELVRAYQSNLCEV